MPFRITYASAAGHNPLEAVDRHGDQVEAYPHLPATVEIPTPKPAASRARVSPLRRWAKTSSARRQADSLRHREITVRRSVIMLVRWSGYGVNSGVLAA